VFRTIDRECEWWLGFNMSVAVAVRFIALAGVAAETGVIMLICLDQAMKALQAERAAEGQGVYAGRPMREARSTARKQQNKAPAPVTKPAGPAN